MANFGTTSLARLQTCHPSLQMLMREVVKVRDISIVEGHRGEEAQNKAFDEGKSKLRWPDGKHNALPSLAVDIVPWPEQFSSVEAMTHVAGIVLGVAHIMGFKVRWGGDWNRDGDLANDRWDDLWHFELEERK